MISLGFIAAFVSFSILLFLCIKTLVVVYQRSMKEGNELSYSDIILAMGISIEACFDILELCAVKLWAPISEWKISISGPARMSAVLSWMISTTAFMMYIIRMCPYFDIKITKSKRKAAPRLNSKMFNFLILMVICISALAYLGLEAEFVTFESRNPLLILSFFNLGGIPISYNLMVFTLLCFIITNAVVNSHFTYFLGRKQDASYFLFVVAFTSRLALRFNCFSFNQIREGNFTSYLYQVMFGLTYVMLSYYMYKSLMRFITTRRG